LQEEVAKEVKKSQEGVAKEVKKSQDEVSKEVKKSQEKVAKEIAKEVQKSQEEVSKEVQKSQEKVAKEVAKEVKKSQEEVSKEVKKLQEEVAKEVKKSQEEVAKEVKKSQEEVAKEVKKLEEVLQPAQRAQRAFDKLDQIGDDAAMYYQRLLKLDSKLFDEAVELPARTFYSAVAALVVVLGLSAHLVSARSPLLLLTGAGWLLEAVVFPVVVPAVCSQLAQLIESFSFNADKQLKDYLLVTSSLLRTLLVATVVVLWTVKFATYKDPQMESLQLLRQMSPGSGDTSDRKQRRLTDFYKVQKGASEVASVSSPVVTKKTSARRRSRAYAS